MAYLLDSNVFIEAKNRFYGFDFCPAYWEWLIVENAAGTVLSIEEVGAEVRSGNDALAEWAIDRDDSFFVKPSPPVLAALGQVTDWAIEQSYEPPAVAALVEGADGYLIAHALAGGHDVVTLEVPSQTRKRVKIPNACISLGVRCLTPFEMLSNERARFVLEPRR